MRKLKKVQTGSKDSTDKLHYQIGTKKIPNSKAIYISFAQTAQYIRKKFLELTSKYPWFILCCKIERFWARTLLVMSSVNKSQLTKK